MMMMLLDNIPAVFLTPFSILFFYITDRRYNEFVILSSIFLNGFGELFKKGEYVSICESDL